MVNKTSLRLQSYTIFFNSQTKSAYFYGIFLNIGLHPAKKMIFAGWSQSPWVYNKVPLCNITAGPV